LRRRSLTALPGWRILRIRFAAAKPDGFAWLANPADSLCGGESGVGARRPERAAARRAAFLYSLGLRAKERVDGKKQEQAEDQTAPQPAAAQSRVGAQEGRQSGPGLSHAAVGSAAASSELGVDPLRAAPGV